MNIDTNHRHLIFFSSNFMNLRSLDLNLLLVFDAIYSEENISKAAVKLHLSQPAVSNALARLRTSLNDPLFERTTQGMMPTPRAKGLVEPIRRALDILQQSLREENTFDFTNSQREFVIAVGDYGETVILPRFLDWLTTVAPKVRITIRPESSDQLRGELRDGSVDMACDYFPLLFSGFKSYRLMNENLLTISRKKHPIINEELDLNTYLKLRHVAIEPRSRTTPMIDLALAKQGLQRTISIIVPHFMSMPVMVNSSDMVCTLPQRMAKLYVQAFHLKAYTVPLRIPNFPVYLIWHDSFEEDSGHQWLRTNLIEFTNRL